MNVKNILGRAQKRYGYKNQIIVTAEELAELTQALLKYARYPDHETALAKTREKVLEEYADAMIVLGHVEMIYGLTQEEVDGVIRSKMERMERWLDTDKGFEQTTVDRVWKK
jgi:NTP pyrophosphatase (non-canonical NTP hydrolase)